MRIRRVRIDSFAGVQRFTSGDLDPNMNLIYGPNESGKTSISEFLRSTLFPSRFKYPASSKTDSGVVEVVMDDGDERTLLREFKKVREKDGKKTVEEEFPGLDAETYRSLYGLDLTRLNDEKVLSSHDFKSRFLTVPGGEHVPEISDGIEESLDNLMTRDRMTENKQIGSKLREIRDVDSELRSVNSDIDRYEILAAERDMLVDKISEKKKLDTLNKDEETRNILMNAQKQNIEKLRELQAQRTNIERYRNFPLETKKQYDSYKLRLDEIQQKLDEIPFGTAEESEILSLSGEIQAAWDARPYYISNLQKVETIDAEIEVVKKNIYDLEEKSGYSVERSRKLRTGTMITDMAANEIMIRRKSTLSPTQRRLLGLLIIASTIMALVGIFLTMKGSSAGIALTITGSILFVLGCLIPIYVKPNSKEIGDWSTWISEQGYPEDISPEAAIELSQLVEQMNFNLKKLNTLREEKKLILTSIENYENAIRPIFLKFGYSTTDYAEGMVQLLSVLRTVEDRRRTKPTTELEAEFDYQKEQLNTLLKKFGGEKEFLRQYELKAEIDGLDAEIRTLTESIEKSSGVSIGELMMFFDGISNKDAAVIETYNIDEMNQRIGELNAQLAVLHDDNRLYDINQRKMDAETELSELLREWAVNAVAKNLIAEAISHFYNDLEPQVIKTANRYIGIMTEGRYKLVSDPRLKSITIEDSYMQKSSNQWSSGLGDLVYLAIKMAMAKEMGTERMPMIFDDVLVRFDADRKECACRAIYDFAADNQVLMFTCDNTLRNYFALCGRFNEIHLI